MTPATLAIGRHDEELRAHLERLGARVPVLLRFAAVEEDGRTATLLGRVPVGQDLALEPRHREAIADALRDAAASLDAGGDGRVYTAAELTRIIDALELSHRKARAGTAFLELRLRLGRLGLPPA